MFQSTLFTTTNLPTKRMLRYRTTRYLGFKKWDSDGMLYLPMASTDTALNDMAGHNVSIAGSIPIQTFSGRVCAQMGAGTINISYADDMNYGGSSFTIEFWIYIAGGSSIFRFSKDETGVGLGYNYGGRGNRIVVFLSRDAYGRTWAGSASITTDLALESPLITTASAWNHFALVRDGDVYTTYLNGVAGSSRTLAGALYVPSVSYLQLGLAWLAGGQISGYLGPVRILRRALTPAEFLP